MHTNASLNRTKKYNLLVPLAGRGQRFVDEGYTVPKYMIMAHNQHLIDWAFDSIDTSECNLIFCLRQDHISNFAVDDIFRQKFGEDITIIPIDRVTRGSVETCLLAEDHIDSDLPLVIYTVDVNFDPVFNPADLDPEIDGCILTFKANSTNYSYAQTNAEGQVTLCAEKEVISENAAAGVYTFKSGRMFCKYARKMITGDIRTNGEFYITPMYNLMVADDLDIRIQPVDTMYVMGTPKEHEFFTTRCVKVFGEKPIALACDHSGFKLKETCKNILDELEIKYIDYGTYVEKNCDQFDYVYQATRSIQSGTTDFAIGFCCTGQAVNISANKQRDIRGALCPNKFMARAAVEHNCANFFSVPQQFVSGVELMEFIKIWRTAKFKGGRHIGRVQKIEENAYR